MKGGGEGENWQLGVKREGLESVSITKLESFRKIVAPPLRAVYFFNDTILTQSYKGESAVFKALLPIP